jgi:hypothetical protein
VSVTFAVATGGGTVVPTTALTTDANGIAQVTSWTLGTTAGANTLTATSAGLTGSPLTFTATGTAGAATQIAINAGNNQTAAAGAAVTVPPSVIVKDVNNNPVSGVSVTFAVASGGGTVVPTTAVTTGANGIAQVTSWTLGASAGANTLTATSAGIPGSPLTFSATATAGTASKLTLTTQAAGAAAGAAFTIQPVVAVQDAQGNTIATDVTTQVQMTVSAGATTVGTTTRTAVNGVVTFTGVGITGTSGTPYTLTFASPNVPALTQATQSITPTVGAATKLVLTRAAAGAVTGLAFTTQPQVTVQDAGGNTVTSSAATMQMTASTGATVVGTGTATASSGVATWANVGITGTAGTQYTLTYAGTGSFSGLTSATQTITPTGTATKLALSIQAAGAQSGAAFTTQPVVAIQDAGSRTVTSDNSTVVTMAASVGATPVGTVTATAVAGLATFTNVGISGTAGTPYTLTFTSVPALTQTTQSITPIAGAATQLVLTRQAAGAANGQAFTTQPQVAVRDAQGNTRTTDFSTVVTMTVSAGATIVGTATAAASAGVATFAGVGISGSPGTAYTLTFASGTLTSATQSITAAVGPANKLALTRAAATAAVGAAFGTQPQVTIQDVNGNTETGDNTTVVTMTVSAGGTVFGPATATAAAGVATFAGTGIIGTSGTAYTLTYGSGSLTQVTQSITPTVGAATQLGLTRLAAGSVSGAAFTQQPRVAVQDVGGNTVTGAPATVITMTTSATGTVPATATATTASGVATFSGVGITGTAGTQYSLTFTPTGQTWTAATQNITVLTATGTKLALTTQPSTVAASGSPLPVQPVVQIQDASSNPVASAGVTVTASVGGGGSVTNATAVTNASGAATFTNLTITGTAASYTLSFAAAPLTSVTAAAATSLASRLALTTQPSGKAASANPLVSQPVVQLQDANNANVAVAGVTVTAGFQSGSGTITNGTAVTNASGVATFSGLAITGTGSPQLRFTSGSMTAAVAGSATTLATKLVITIDPAVAAVSGRPLSGIQVAVQDASGNPVDSTGVTVTASTSSTSGGASVSGNTATPSGGFASFINLAITGNSPAYSLVFSVPGLTSATSAPIRMATKMVLHTLPSTTAASGVPFATQPEIWLVDSVGAQVPVANVGIIATTPTGSITFSGEQLFTDANGVATYTALTLIAPTVATPEPAYQLRFSTDYAPAAIFAPTSVALAITVKLNTQPSTSGTSGVPLAQQPVVQLVDVNNSNVAVTGIPMVASLASGTATITNGTANTNASGAATFSGLALTGTGSNTLQFNWAANNRPPVAASAPTVLP